MAEEKPVAVVTGAAQGIGRRAAEQLAERHYRVALNDLHAAEATIDGIQSKGGEVTFHAGNIADEAVVEKFV